MRRPVQLSLIRNIAAWLMPAARPARGLSRPKAVRSAPDLQQLWRTLREEYFPECRHIDEFVVTWSKRRQKRVLASCNIRRRVVHVAQELAPQELEGWLSPLLHHEMCHAALGEKIERRGRKRCWHGREFKRLAARHPLNGSLERWIRGGGWLSAVRSHRSRASAALRRKRAVDG
jgi:hypothetical protein